MIQEFNLQLLYYFIIYKYDVSHQNLDNLSEEIQNDHMNPIINLRKKHLENYHIKDMMYQNISHEKKTNYKIYVSLQSGLAIVTNIYNVLIENLYFDVTDSFPTYSYVTNDPK